MKLNLTQSHKVCLTPELQHGIKILSYSRDELKDEINSVFKNNIFLVKNYSNTLSNHVPYDFLNNTSSDVSLKEFLVDQIHLHTSCQSIESECYSLIQMIDDSGRITDDLTSLNFNHIEECLQIIQKMEPDGVGGRNLKETLLIQCATNKYHSEIDLLSKIDLRLIVNPDYKKISSLTGYSKRSIIEMLKNIKSLNPNPGYNFGGKILSDSIDGFIQNDGGSLSYGIYEFSNRISITSDFKKIFDKNDKYYDQYLKAKSLINGIKHRDTSLLKILAAISVYQEDYFVKGSSHLLPMTMNDIGDIVGLHESTISRISGKKNIQTPFGVLPLRDIFCSGVKKDNGSIASLSVKSIIKDIISEELPTKPISDNKITNKLNNLGIDISRRTTAKYRASLGIEKSSDRKI